jgi:hypothetical protein
MAGVNLTTRSALDVCFWSVAVGVIWNSGVSDALVSMMVALSGNVVDTVLSGNWPDFVSPAHPDNKNTPPLANNKKSGTILESLAREMAIGAI